MRSGPASLHEIKAMHDLQLALHPEHEHPPCALCNLEDTTMADEDKVYTAAELAAQVEAAVTARLDDAVAAALQPVQAELETLRAAAGATEVDQAVATATAGLTAQLAEMTAERDAAIADATAAGEARDTLQATIDAGIEADAVETRKGERVKAVKDMEFWTEEFIDAQADGWAKLTDEAWGDKVTELEGLRDNSRAAAGAGGNGTVRDTVLPNGRPAGFAPTPAGGTPAGESAARTLIRRTAQLSTAPAGN